MVTERRMKWWLRIIPSLPLKCVLLLRGHYVPGSVPKNNAQEKIKYAADAIDEMINRMTQTGTQKCDIEVCLGGGGNVLKRDDDTICKDNIKSTTSFLENERIPIRPSVLGGTKRKGVFMDVENGKIFYVEGESGEKLLWETVRRSEK